MPMISGGYTCRDIVDASSAFIDGELTWFQWVRFRVHLLTCPPCARYVAQIGITVDALRGLEGHEGERLRSELMSLFDGWTKDHLPDDEGDE